LCFETQGRTPTVRRRERESCEPPRVDSLRQPRPAAVILAAGTGSRLGQPSKPLAVIAGATLLERAVTAVRAAGAERVIVVVGHAKEAVERFVAERGLDVELVENDHFAVGNASSVVAGGRHAGTRFVLLMADHLVAPEAVARLVESDAAFAVAVDTAPGECDIAEATKVRLYDGAVAAVDKELDEWDALDVGLFVCDASVVETAERTVAAGEGTWNAVKRRWIAEGRRLAAIDVAGLFWLDVDTPDDARVAERLLVERAAAKSLDGPVSRHLNRPLSRRLSLLFVRVGLSPNAVTAIAFATALVAAAAVAVGRESAIALVLGGLLVQLASIVDGCDGGVARATLRSSPAGAFLDSNLDRVADAAVLVALAAAAGFATRTWVALVAALFGTLLVPYVKAAYEAAFGESFAAAQPAFTAGRDVRMLVVALAAVALQPWWGLLAVALLANAEAVRRAVVGWRAGHGKSPLGGGVRA
jgi:1L-myo-inositol 1-phosphate cytidylyltransferase / CDP-L-myo-inositol myo-inositolphosphotransferase